MNQGNDKQLKNPAKIPVTFFQRKPLPSGNFSLEFIFSDIRDRLTNKISPTVHIASHFSRGFLPRLKICLDMRRNQNVVNHVAGDINFAGILSSPSKTIQTILDCGNVDRSTGLKKFVLRLLWIRLPVSRAKFATTISNHAKQQIVSHANCDADKVHVIHVAVSQSYVANPKPFPAKTPRILQVGTANNKNIERLAAALKGVDCELAIVGVVNESQQAALNTNNVKYEQLQNLSNSEMVEEYNKADIIAFASTYEGFGMPIVEANCVGRPVLTSNVCSMPEVAGDAACLVDPFDVGSIRAGILKIIEDAEYRDRLIANGFENAKRFHPDEIARQYLELYQRIADTS
jgi:glycosyltransferase involved in cell wall biosynthesis